MLRTLHGYLLRDLIRATILALVVFTLVMTVLAIIEPLRKQGLMLGQVGQLFLFTLPVMLSLTLPFAALFAASIVYGRFAQDQEWQACRASGVSTLTVLQPAILLGVLVTVIAMTLTNFVAPKMAKMAAHSVVRNIQQFAYTMIRKESCIRFGDKYYLHATWVDDKNDALYGVVAGEFDYKRDRKTGAPVPVMQAMVAQVAHLDTKYDPGEDRYYASVVPESLVGPISNQATGQFESEEIFLRNMEVPNPTKDRVAFYEWETLVRMLRDPSLHGEIRKDMAKARETIQRNRVLKEMADTIQAGEPYRKFARGGQVYELRAAKAVVSGDRATLASGDLPRGEGRSFVPVSVRMGSGRDAKEVFADAGTVTVKVSQITNQPQVSIELSGNVRLPAGAVQGGEMPRQAQWSVGQIPLPPDPKIPNSDDPRIWEEQISDIYQNPEEYTDDPKVLGEIQGIKSALPTKIRREILGEMNLRVAFGLSCLFLVSLGAAMGIVFRGGQLLVAFTISSILGAVVILVILSGKRIIGNPKSSDVLGMLVMWGGLASMCVTNIVVYWRLCRK